MTGGDTPQGPMTAEEFMEQIANDDEYQRIVADQNRFRQVQIDRNFRDERTMPPGGCVGFGTGICG